MEILQLKYFIHVAELEHISNAAEDLHISQPALSLTLKRLENELGVDLFKRQGRNIKLTEEGQIFLNKVKPACSLITEAANEIKSNSDKNKKKVSIVSPPLYSYSELFLLLRESIPDLVFRNIYTSTSDAMDLLRAKEIDFFIAPLDKYSDIPDDMEVLVLKENTMYAVLPKNHKFAGRKRLDPLELKNEKFASYPPQLGSRPILENYYENIGEVLNVTMECNTSNDLVQLVTTGGYVTLLQNAIARFHSNKDLAIVELEPPIDFSTCMVKLKAEPLRPIAKKVSDIMVHYFKTIQKP